MKETPHRAVTSGFNHFAVLALSAAAFVCIVTSMRAQGHEEEVYSAKEETIPPGESSWVLFTASRQTHVTFEYKVESGKVVDLYILTEAQFDHGRAGAEPTQAGNDFLRHLSKVSGQGSTVETLSPGRYAIVFRNRSGQSVRVWTHSTAARL
jgi:hypothetical protein